jgi:hypothetical protein
MAKFQAIICHPIFCWNQNVGAPICSRGYSWKESEKENHESDDKQNKRKKYEENRKARKFNVKWLTNREWLDYDESNNIMTCKTVLTYMNILYVIQLSDRVYNVTFPAYDLYSLRRSCAEGNIDHKPGMSHYIPCLIAE